MVSLCLVSLGSGIDCSLYNLWIWYVQEMDYREFLFKSTSNTCELCVNVGEKVGRG